MLQYLRPTVTGSQLPILAMGGPLFAFQHLPPVCTLPLFIECCEVRLVLFPTQSFCCSAPPYPHSIYLYRFCFLRAQSANGQLCHLATRFPPAVCCCLLLDRGLNPFIFQVFDDWLSKIGVFVCKFPRRISTPERILFLNQFFRQSSYVCSTTCSTSPTSSNSKARHCPPC